MRINHNIAALNTHRQLNSATTAQSKSMEKLASGLRINKAGDDAAGLAISEKMRGQIRGLDMASKNAQDGISLIATAEGALNETHDILQRMRELAVQAGNDTNVDSDRNEIQKEINQLTSEVNRIGNTTEFNTKKLVNGDLSSKFEVSPAVTSPATTVNVTKAVTQTITVGDEPVAWGANSKADFDVVIAGKADNGFDWGNLNTTAPTNLVITKDGDDFKVTFSGTDMDGGTPKTLDIAADLVSLDKSTGTYSYDNQGISFSFKNADTENWADGEAVTIDLSTFATAGNATGTINTVPENVALNIAGTASPAATANMTAIAVDGSGALLEGVDKIDVKWDEGAETFTVTQSAGADVKSTTTFSLASGETLKFDADGIKFDFTGTAGTGANDAVITGSFALKTETTAVTTAPTVTSPAVVEDRSASFQIGANENQSMSVGINDMRASALGLTGTGAEFTAIKDVTNGTNSTAVESAIDVSSHTNAAKAVTTINKAIETVSAERSKLGANQNRLEHTINNLSTSSENLTAAESRVRDVDYALAA